MEKLSGSPGAAGSRFALSRSACRFFDCRLFRLDGCALCRGCLCCCGLSRRTLFHRTVLQIEYRKRCKGEGDALFKTVHGNGERLEFLFRDAAAAVDCCICIEYHLVSAFLRQPDLLVVALHRAEVADGDDLVSVVVNTPEGDDALLIVVVGDPAESLPGIVILPECGVVQIEFVQIL